MEENTKEWLTIESLVAGLADIARVIKDTRNSTNNTSDETCKTRYRGMHPNISDERCKQAEKLIEANPEQAAASLPQGSDIQKEAVQAAQGGRGAEVNNKVVDNDISKMSFSERNNFFKSNPNYFPSIEQFNALKERQRKSYSV